MLGTVGHKVVAIGQLAKHHTVNQRADVGALVALVRHTELTGVRCCHVGHTSGESDFVGAILVKPHLITLQVVDGTGLQFGERGVNDP